MQKDDSACFISVAPTTSEKRRFMRISQFSRLVEIYAGSVSTVYKAVEVATGRAVVIKAYHKRRMKGRDHQRLTREICIAERMIGDFVTLMLGTFEDAGNIYLVMEWCQGGDLFNSTRRLGTRLDEAYVCVQIIAPLLRVLEKMHRQQMIHRDIKPENIFLSHGGFDMRVGDFGLAIDCTQEIPFSRSGTLDYMAPEVLKNPTCGVRESPEVTLEQLAALNVKPYTSKVDTWAVGILAYELVMGKTPFSCGDETKTIQLITQSTKVALPVSGHSKAWADFVNVALVNDPDERADVETLLRHPWIQHHLRQARPSVMMDKLSQQLPLKQRLATSPRPSTATATPLPPAPAASAPHHKRTNSAPPAHQLPVVPSPRHRRNDSVPSPPAPAPPSTAPLWSLSSMDLGRGPAYGGTSDAGGGSSSFISRQSSIKAVRGSSIYASPLANSSFSRPSSAAASATPSTSNTPLPTAHNTPLHTAHSLVSQMSGGSITATPPRNSEFAPPRPPAPHHQAVVAPVAQMAATPPPPTTVIAEAKATPQVQLQLAPAPVATVAPSPAAPVAAPVGSAARAAMPLSLGQSRFHAGVVGDDVPAALRGPATPAAAAAVRSAAPSPAAPATAAATAVRSAAPSPAAPAPAAAPAVRSAAPSPAAPATAGATAVRSAAPSPNRAAGGPGVSPACAVGNGGTAGLSTVGNSALMRAYYARAGVPAAGGFQGASGGPVKKVVRSLKEAWGSLLRCS